MNLTVYTKDDIVERVKIDCSPVEWFIINKALRQFVEDKENHQTDTMIASSMFNEKPRFTDSCVLDSITLEEVKAKCQTAGCKECPFYVVNTVSEYCIFDIMPAYWEIPK